MSNSPTDVLTWLDNSPHESASYAANWIRTRDKQLATLRAENERLVEDNKALMNNERIISRLRRELEEARDAAGATYVTEIYDKKSEKRADEAERQLAERTNDYMLHTRDLEIRAETAEAERDAWKSEAEAAKCCDNHANVVEQLQAQIDVENEGRKRAEASLGNVATAGFLKWDGRYYFRTKGDVRMEIVKKRERVIRAALEGGDG